MIQHVVPLSTAGSLDIQQLLVSVCSNLLLLVVASHQVADYSHQIGGVVNLLLDTNTDRHRLASVFVRCKGKSSVDSYCHRLLLIQIDVQFPSWSILRLVSLACAVVTCRTCRRINTLAVFNRADTVVSKLAGFSAYAQSNAPSLGFGQQWTIFPSS